ncbi:MAG: Methyltransferase type 11 [Geminicoccaceae bacterium]|nr:Methyltransferase type 11 [Geminicoccaceae bacterium]
MTSAPGAIRTGKASCMDGKHGRETWAAGDAYEHYVGRWSRLVAEPFLDWLRVPAGRSWLDVGCGTGALSAAILQHARPARVTGLDASEGFLSHARGRLKDRRAIVEQGDARALPYDDGRLDAAVSGLVLNFVADPTRMAAEMRRVVRPGGTVALYVWDYAGKMELMRYFWDAAAALDAAARELDEGVRFPVCRPEPLAELLGAAGLVAVETRALDVPTVFADFDDYWSPFLGGQGPAPAYCVALPEEKRARLRERLRRALPVERDGRIALLARAWAARGMVPRS